MEPVDLKIERLEAQKLVDAGYAELIVTSDPIAGTTRMLCLITNASLLIPVLEGAKKK